MAGSAGRCQCGGILDSSNKANVDDSIEMHVIFHTEGGMYMYRHNDAPKTGLPRFTDTYLSNIYMSLP